MAGAPVRSIVVNALRNIVAQAESGSVELVDDGEHGVTAVLGDGTVRCRITLPSAGSSPPDGVLSARERQIARLVADGATNRAIGDVLGISAWTVSAHVRRIFAKLGVSSRAQMVARLSGAPPAPLARR